MAKWIMALGLLIFIVGVIIWLLSGLGIPFGKLPGDIEVKGEKVSFYFPIVTSIVISLIFTIIVNLIFYILRKS